jgi:hypothetical protein
MGGAHLAALLLAICAYEQGASAVAGAHALPLGPQPSAHRASARQLPLCGRATVDRLGVRGHGCDAALARDIGEVHITEVQQWGGICCHSDARGKESLGGGWEGLLR